MTRRAEDLAAHLLEAFRDARRAVGDSRYDPGGWATELADHIVRIGEDRGHGALATAVRDSVKRVATRLDAVTLAATGMAWLGAGVPSVERVLVELVVGAQREVLVTAYSITDGAYRLWEAIEKGATTGVRFRFVVNDLDAQSPGAVATLVRLAHLFPQSFELYDFVPDDTAEPGGLHAKIVVVDRATALVGSANLSHHGLVAAHEMALVVQGPTSEAIGAAVDRLLRSPRVRRRG